MRGRATAFYWPLIFLYFFQCYVSSSPSPISEDEQLVRPGRIVNGEQAKQGEIPYQASLQFVINGVQTGGFCGGTFIDHEWVLTAGHCVKDRTVKQIQVVGGAIDVSTKDNPSFDVKTIHEFGYDSKTHTRDFALLRLQHNNRAEGSDPKHPIVPVKLASTDFSPYNRECIVSGYGKLASGGKSTPHLEKVTLRVLDQKSCRSAFENISMGSSYYEDAMICAGGGDKDACQGDSGGPLVCPDDSGNLFISGVVSWGIGCASPGIPGVYTNIQRYAPEIIHTMQKVEREERDSEQRK